MSYRLKILFLFTLSSALIFGFAHLLFQMYHFERLHIFLFNLCTGGTIIYYYTENTIILDFRAKIFFCLSLCYALCVFIEFYLLAIIISISLSILVEAARVKKFSSWFPFDFFKADTLVSDKFHQASLLCLSIGLVISAFAIINHEYITFINSEKFQLETFFLGFSFPLSLITFSLIFSHLDNEKVSVFLKNLAFWTINLGVIIFFIFILMGCWIGEFLISCILFSMVLTVLYIHKHYGHNNQQKQFLFSGLFFLILTSMSGLIYIVYYLLDIPPESHLILRLHTLYSLYGWNLSGLIIICRYNDFPLKINSLKIIIFHWIIIAFLAPIGYYNMMFSFITCISYIIFLYIIFFSNRNENNNNIL